MTGEFFGDLCHKVSQRVSYQLGDLVMSYPDFLRPLVLATIQAILTAQLQTIPEPVRELYETALDKMTVVSIPPAMDPRKEGPKP
ncbi:MAG: hypothetical protein Q4E45_02325 [Eubacteriales bacterium]|nr:hypothetical protein [Eubacteriales bacterium]